MVDKAGHKQGFYILATIIWMALIFYLSSIPDLKTSLPSVWDLILRKIAHMVEFGVLTFFAWQGIRGSKKSLTIAVIVSILYALSDEWHQSFVLGRSGTLADVLIDTVGVFISLTIIKNTLVKSTVEKTEV